MPGLYHPPLRVPSTHEAHTLYSLGRHDRSESGKALDHKMSGLCLAHKRERLKELRYRPTIIKLPREKLPAKSRQFTSMTCWEDCGASHGEALCPERGESHKDL